MLSTGTNPRTCGTVAINSSREVILRLLVIVGTCSDRRTLHIGEKQQPTVRSGHCSPTAPGCACCATLSTPTPTAASRGVRGARADPFEVYSTLVGKGSVWAGRNGRLTMRSPLSNLSSIEPRPGLIGVVGVLFGSTGFDSFGDSPAYVSFVQGSQINGHVINNVTLIAFCLGATAIIALGSALTGVGPDQRRRDLPNAFAHSIVPIVIGYVVAHYLNYFVEVGSRTVQQASDPFSNGSNHLGPGNWSDVTYLAYHPTLLANIKVAAVVFGHIVAHERTLHLLPARHQVTGQLPLLLAMVGFTSGGLYLLFSS